MQIEQPTENWTRFPNSILDNLTQLTGSELKVVSLIVRQNFGFSSNPNTKFSSSYIAVKTGIGRSTAVDVLDSLSLKGIIKETGTSEDGCKNYIAIFSDPVQNPDSPETGHPSKNQTPTCPKTGHPPVQKLDTSKETNLNKQLKETKEETPVSENPALRMEMGLRLTNPLIDLFVRKRKELYFENPDDIRLTITHHKERMHLQNILEHFKGDLKKIERYMFLFSIHSFYGKQNQNFVLSPSKFYNAIPDLRDHEHILSEEKKDREEKENLKKAAQSFQTGFYQDAKKIREQMPKEEEAEISKMFEEAKRK